jgi:hypothetical protein
MSKLTATTRSCRERRQHAHADATLEWLDRRLAGYRAVTGGSGRTALLAAEWMRRVNAKMSERLS